MRNFVLDPDRGRPVKQEYIVDNDENGTCLEPNGHTYTEGLHDRQEPRNRVNPALKSGRGKQVEEDGKVVDIVLSDMCEPWPLTDGFWKRSLSDPYFRMMNTSGISFKDHAGSMVRVQHLRVF